MRIQNLVLFVAAIPSLLAQPPAAPQPATRPFLSPMWGWSEPGDKVRVEIAGKSVEATAAADGKWQAVIQPPAPGGPYVVKVTGRQSVTLHEVLVGDVWLCGGQSNMGL